MRKLRIYIAGAISKGDLSQNIAIASGAFFQLLHAGLAPLCPHWSAYSGGPYDAPKPMVLPNGTTHEDWMGVDLPWVEVADAVLRIPGDSRGADQEVDYARAKSIPVFLSVQSLIEHYKQPFVSRENALGD